MFLDIMQKSNRLIEFYAIFVFLITTPSKKCLVGIWIPALVAEILVFSWQLTFMDIMGEKHMLRWPIWDISKYVIIGVTMCKDTLDITQRTVAPEK